MMLRMFFFFVLLVSGAYADPDFRATINLLVKDDAGTPVPNVAVEGCFLDVSQSGALTRFKGLTDTNGCFVAKGRTILGVYADFELKGYYPTVLKEEVEYVRKLDGRGYEKIDHWKKDIPVILKRIRNPIPMYIKDVSCRYIDMWLSPGVYNLGNTARYDIVKGDFLSPHGEGEVADIEFTREMTIYTRDEDDLAVDYDILKGIRLLNGEDGICRGVPDGTRSGTYGSAFYSAYEAPESGYTNRLIIYRNVRGDKADTNDDNHYLYYFRIRTQTNEAGEIVSARYGQIHGEIDGPFTYFLNPTPNDRNVEHDSKKNLFKESGK